MIRLELFTGSRDTLSRLIVSALAQRSVQGVEEGRTASLTSSKTLETVR